VCCRQARKAAADDDYVRHGWCGIQGCVNTDYEPGTETQQNFAPPFVSNVLFFFRDRP
jgi:hypothetical protein